MPAAEEVRSGDAGDRQITHFPTPAVSPGSPVLIVIEDLLREAAEQGIRDEVLIEPWRGERFRPEWITPASTPRDLMQNRLVATADHIFGKAVGRRPATEELYRSSMHGVDLERVTELVLHDGSFAFGGARLLGARRRHYGLSYYSHIALSRSLDRRELRAMLDRLDHCIQVSDFMAERLRERVGYDHPALVTVHNGVDPTQFSPRPDGLNLERRIAWVGKIGANKGPDKVLEALRHCAVTDWTMTIVGSSWYAAGGEPSPFEQQLHAMAEQLAGTTEFVGYKPRSELPGILRDQRIFVFPTMLDEAFGLVLLEAMASGLACVASPRGGVPEFARDAVILLDPNDSREFGGTLEWLLTDDVAASELGQKARDRALEYTTQRQYARLREVLFGPETAPHPAERA
ncbi:glycosyltransferase family 4 protein [Raineyella fluvialis]|uniref:Glycosyltransferase n=1 Tax=Raineyella fluvialis TaxID=2662261 RepID=A0A5Q2FGQ7_9ACTN|nr:glycosyltransferase family 4 protein [Raineyella fluvialis]QGF23885.1 glycosyltransferase [Raineyella fluvialis]